ncbi:SirB2 family protein [Undibacterium flavidum]|uniref:SirB2 family protein n=1 Tax=Undibacterium flavidum TaxID=2762297 RepID=A0ABR6YFB7_9BURK|nr:SirB2 family protein [Undibacterium flavidum]MBC3875217.1 SirB2 family protein [Undibacterium flavidum]
MYIILKHLHLTCITLSICLFTLRFYWRKQNPLMLQKKWVKILPHGIDSLLLASAISMAWIASINPLEQPWLAAKIIALFAYIMAGTFALKRAQTARAQNISFALALMCFAYIIAVAISKQPFPFMN